MKLYDFPHAPNPRKVRVYLAEKGLTLPTVPVDLMKGEQRSPEFLAKNPMGGLPVLELDDGTILPESLAIMEYLEELHPDPPMVGTSPLERARVRALERRIELALLFRVGTIFFHTSPVFGDRPQVAAVAENAANGLSGAWAAIDAEVGDHPFAAGERPTIADCTLYATVRHAELAAVPMGEEFRNLQRWKRDFSERPSAKA